MPQSKRNLLLTKTAIGIYVLVCGNLIAISPNIERLISRGKSDDYKANIRDTMAIAISVVGAVGAFVGRYDAGGTYTPKYLPGEDPLPPLQ